MPAGKQKLPKALSELHSAEQALCYAAEACIRGAYGATRREELTRAVERWIKVRDNVTRLLGAELRSPLATGGGGGTPLAVEVRGLPSSEAEDSNLTSKSKEDQPRTTWLTPYSDAWQAQYHGKPNYGVLAKALKPLHDEHGPEETLVRWRLYLKETPGRFASPRRFAETFGEWDRRQAPERRDWTRRSADVAEPLPNETPDAYLARVSRA